MESIFTRVKLNPILQSENSSWAKIYNPGAAVGSDTHLFPRVSISNTRGVGTSIGHAISIDGERFMWKEDVVLTRLPLEDEKIGFEDPRVTRIDDTYHMVFAVYDGMHVALHSATAPSLNGPWTRQGPMVPEFNFFQSGGRIVRFESGKPVEKGESKRGTHWSKSGALFPEKINGEYVLMFGEFYLWLASSTDGKHFQVKQPGFIGPRKGTNFFDNVFVEMGPPPIRTERGWLVLYHGVNEKFQYQIGFLLLDLKDPSKILYRSNEPIFGPQEDYELVSDKLDIQGGGLTPEVTFCCGAIVKDSELWIYYGAGDAVVCAAYAPLKSVLQLAPLV